MNGRKRVLEMPIRVDSHVLVYGEAEVHDDGTITSNVIFEDTVVQYVPETGLLRFEESDMGRAPFKNMLDEAAGYQIIVNR